MNTSDNPWTNKEQEELEKGFNCPMCGHYMGVPDDNPVGYYLKCDECGKTWEFVWDEVTEEFEDNWIEPEEDILKRPEECRQCNLPWPACEAKCRGRWDYDLYE